MASAALQIQNLNKSFNTNGNVTRVLSRIELTVKENEFIAFIGPSGCGKSTLLRIVAGLDQAYDGSVEINGKQVTGPSKDKGFIFQEHRLFPWLTVEKNIAADYSLEDPQVREKVAHLIKTVRLTGFEKAYPKQLSGGMSQRVAIARALLRNPQVLLLDEPFGALDAFTRSHLQEVLLDVWRENQTTVLFVTHDIDEAVFLSNKVVVLDARPGTIKATFNIDLPYPRNRTNHAFQQYRLGILEALENPKKADNDWEI